jgi:hypothetical protein
MSPGREPNNAWLFVRDEIDLLEEEFDEIFRRHDALRDPVRHALEESVLKEQLETEEATESEVALHMGPKLVEEERGAPPPSIMEEFDSVGSLREWLKRDVMRDPFYESVFLWSTRVAKWAKEAYDRNPQSRDLFRIYVNACLVPAKVAFGQSEETHEHEDALELASKEYELASVYLRRVQDSLQTLEDAGSLPAESVWMFSEANQIAEKLAQARRRLSQPRPFRP